MTESNKPRELLPCPFCGGEAEYWEHLDPEIYQDGKPCSHNVDCSVCDGNLKEQPTKAEAIKAWNTRPDNLEAEIEAMRKGVAGGIREQAAVIERLSAKLTAATKERDEANSILKTVVIKMNKVTAQHRHGMKPTKRAMDKLCNYQLEIEAHLSSLDQQGE